MKIEIFKQRKEELEKKEIHFKNSVMKFDKFLKVVINIYFKTQMLIKLKMFIFKENDTKLRRAVKKAQDERDLQKFKQNEIVRLGEEIEASLLLKTIIAKKISKHKKFIIFLENVLF